MACPSHTSTKQSLQAKIAVKTVTEPEPIAYHKPRLSFQEFDKVISTNLPQDAVPTRADTIKPPRDFHPRHQIRRLGNVFRPRKMFILSYCSM